MSRHHGFLFTLLFTQERIHKLKMSIHEKERTLERKEIESKELTRKLVGLKDRITIGAEGARCKDRLMFLQNQAFKRCRILIGSSWKQRDRLGNHALSWTAHVLHEREKEISLCATNLRSVHAAK